MTILAATVRRRGVDSFGVLAASCRRYDVTVDPDGNQTMQVRAAPPPLVFGDYGVIGGSGVLGIAEAAARLLARADVHPLFVLGGLQMWVEDAVPERLRRARGFWPSSAVVLHHGPAGVRLRVFEVGPAPSTNEADGFVSFPPGIEGFYSRVEFAGQEGLNGPTDGTPAAVAEYLLQLVTAGLREERLLHPTIPADSDQVAVAIVDAAGARLIQEGSPCARN